MSAWIFGQHTLWRLSSLLEHDMLCKCFAWLTFTKGNVTEFVDSLCATLVAQDDQVEHGMAPRPTRIGTLKNKSLKGKVEGSLTNYSKSDKQLSGLRMMDMFSVVRRFAKENLSRSPV